MLIDLIWRLFRTEFYWYWLTRWLWTTQRDTQLICFQWQAHTFIIYTHNTSVSLLFCSTKCVFLSKKAHECMSGCSIAPTLACWVAASSSGSHQSWHIFPCTSSRNGDNIMSEKNHNVHDLDLMKSHVSKIKVVNVKEKSSQSSKATTLWVVKDLFPFIWYSLTKRLQHVSVHTRWLVGCFKSTKRESSYCIFSSTSANAWTETSLSAFS